MNIKDTVYIVSQGSVYDMNIKNSVQIVRGEVLAIKDYYATVKIEAESPQNAYIIQQYDIESLSKTPQQALEKASNLIMTKEATYEQALQHS